MRDFNVPRSLGLERIAELHPQGFFLGVWRDLDAHAQEARNQRTGYDFRPLLVYGWAAICLTLIEYFGNIPAFEAFLYRTHLSIHPLSRSYELVSYAWWTGWRLIGYFLLPALFARVVLKESVGTYGLCRNNARSLLWIYLLLYGVVLGLIAIVSRNEAFLVYYPFYSRAGESGRDFLIWEAMYIAQFFALEFFFRGFLLFPCRDAMGSSAVFAMVVPYTMIHFDKPLLEVFGAIVAGITLGTLALRTRSILGGFLIHAAVALSMDVMALLHRGELPMAW